ncbi:TIGR04222 domain-containing membrane protein [Actinomadura fulvescens]|uniref:TIGR04222 domain-containing membrane protein n=1 Tax=Actinomadura fulvescens TaxID=46160 RepID=A0ABP6BVK4_9ACTN
MAAELDAYEIAFLCGGPDRVARAALVALCADGRITISDEAPYRLVRTSRAGHHPVETSMLEKIPTSGLPIKLVLRTTADSPVVRRCAATLIEKKLLRRSFRGWVGPSRTGEEERERLGESPSDDAVARFAAEGVTALPEGPLRDALTALPPEPEFPFKLPKAGKGSGYDDRGSYGDSGGGGATGAGV